mmetsp:Transcript_11156/g.24627  ORF Transcript_11156/g.24627 Transcript_11156/m.24627 type:complete len:313 (+) Transcript_11156:788-1726(+)
MPVSSAQSKTESTYDIVGRNAVPFACSGRHQKPTGSLTALIPATSDSHWRSSNRIKVSLNSVTACLALSPPFDIKVCSSCEFGTRFSNRSGAIHCSKTSQPPKLTPLHLDWVCSTTLLPRNSDSTLILAGSKSILNMSPGLPSTIQLQPWPDPTSQPARVGWPGARLTKPPASSLLATLVGEAEASTSSGYTRRCHERPTRIWNSSKQACFLLLGLGLPSAEGEMSGQEVVRVGAQVPLSSVFSAGGGFSSKFCVFCTKLAPPPSPRTSPKRHGASAQPSASNTPESPSKRDPLVSAPRLSRPGLESALPFE